jgi:radical SAM superfamily enzyme YgiQ (UPF0313 family)
MEGGQSHLYHGLAEAGSSHPPQGVASLAAILRENGYAPFLIDAEPLGLGADETARRAMELDPAYIGVSSYTISIRVAARIAERAKELAAEQGKRVTVIIGGPHVSCPGMSKGVLERYPQFDIAVPGEGEITLVELIDAMEHSEPIDGIPNVAFRKGGEPQETRSRSPLADMDALPIPAWDLLPQLDRYYFPAGDNLWRLPSCAIITSRGCPGKCFFCNPRGLGREFRRHSAAYIMKMLRYLHQEFGLRDVFIADDMMVSDRENVMEFCRLMQEAKDLDMTWSVFARVDSVDEELLHEMKRARCWQVGYGLESGSERVLRAINKIQTVAQMENAIQWADRAGIVVRGMFMVGNFGESRETLEETIAFARRNPIKDFHITFFTPLPGTASFVQWSKHGTWSADTTEGDTTSLHTGPTFVPHGMSREELVQLQRQLYRAFLKPSTLWYHFKKTLRPSVTKRVLKGGAAFLRYSMVRTGGQLP